MDCHEQPTASRPLPEAVRYVKGRTIHDSRTCGVRNGKRNHPPAFEPEGRNHGPEEQGECSQEQKVLQQTAQCAWRRKAESQASIPSSGSLSNPTSLLAILPAAELNSGLTFPIPAPVEHQAALQLQSLLRVILCPSLWLLRVSAPACTRRKTPAMGE